ncbi:MAG TPA: heterodisulfide reductase-related iron-sulfur binding cluster, partial [Deltaproteobacteria bacterium]|nr:heterodisulfide reductase-related iron-sulfur binding cluster [Deltaproteobacteria bacterium]
GVTTLDQYVDTLGGVARGSRTYDGVDALCCGGPALFVNRELAEKMQHDNISDALDHGAEALITICPMCDTVLREPTAQAGLPMIFITDLCRMAMGEVPWPAG